MPVNLSQTVSEIKKAGRNNVRTTPMPNQDGMCIIEIRDGQSWRVIAEGVPQTTAADMITQATNRVILG